MAMLTRELVIVLSLYIFVDKTYAEIRKLIPLCSNSCRNPGRIQSTNCYCDSRCALVYNDCCLDAPYRVLQTVTIRQNHECVFVPGENKNFLMISTCKDNWKGPQKIRKKCMDATLNTATRDLSGIIPVTNLENEVTFKNYYCSSCNDEDTENLVEWQIKAICPSRCVTHIDVLRNLTYVEDSGQWGVWKWTLYAGWKFYRCFILFEKPSNTSNGVRECIPGLISDCPSTWRDIAVRRKCQSYLDPVRWSRGPGYRNIDCAFCHNRTKKNFQCQYDLTRDSHSAMLNLGMLVDSDSIGEEL